MRTLEKIRGNYGDDVEVVMADNIPIVQPIFSDKYPHGKRVIITDESS